MGRHARGAARSRVPVARLLICSSAVLIVGTAGLLTYRAGPALSTNTVTTTAVVVSSLACTDGPGGTAVDVVDPAGPLAGDTVRASLDACGYQQGQQLAVQYPEGDPTQLSFAGTDAAGDLGTGDRLLPIGLLIAALLAVAAGIAVWLDGRRGNRRSAHGGPAATTISAATIPDDDLLGNEASSGTTDDGETAAGLPAGNSHRNAVLRSTVRRSTVRQGTVRRGTVHRNGAHRSGEAPSVEPALLAAARSVPSRHAPTDDDGATLAGLGFGPADWPAELPATDRPVEPATAGDSLRTRQNAATVDLVFPFTSSLADSLHDELFTHRSVYS